MNSLHNATSLPSAPIFSALNLQDSHYHVLGRCPNGDLSDREIGDLRGETPTSKQFIHLFPSAFDC